jgi:hypothetical protein
VLGKRDNGTTPLGTLAHEVGHTLGLPHVPGEVGGPRDADNPNLTNADRVTHQTNVMAPHGFADLFPYVDTDNDGVLDQKRLTAEQDRAVYTHQRPPGKAVLLNR